MVHMFHISHMSHSLWDNACIRNTKTIHSFLTLITRQTRRVLSTKTMHSNKIQKQRIHTKRKDNQSFDCLCAWYEYSTIITHTHTGTQTPRPRTRHVLSAETMTLIWNTGTMNPYETQRQWIHMKHSPRAHTQVQRPLAHEPATSSQQRQSRSYETNRQWIHMKHSDNQSIKNKTLTTRTHTGTEMPRPRTHCVLSRETMYSYDTQKQSIHMGWLRSVGSLKL